MTTNTTEQDAFTLAVLDHARPMTGGQSWQWTKLSNLWLEGMSDSTDGLVGTVNEIREANGFDPLPE